MEDELISEEDYESLPLDNQRRFLAVERICRRNLMLMLSREVSQEMANLLRTQYMTIVTATAEELGVDGIQYVDNYETYEQDLRDFTRQVGSAVAKIRLRTSSSRDALSVKLANKTKGLIEHQLATLRSIIDDSTLSDSLKRKLLARIEDFRTELHRERLSFGKAMAALALISAGIGGSTSFLSDAPTALETVSKITHLIGVDKEKEDAEVLRLAAPYNPPALKAPAVTPKSQRHVTSSYANELDDDIPF